MADGWSLVMPHVRTRPILLHALHLVSPPGEGGQGPAGRLLAVPIVGQVVQQHALGNARRHCTQDKGDVG